MKNAWADIERFKEQKNHDLKEALISYAVMQISMCKKVGFGFSEDIVYSKLLTNFFKTNFSSVD